MKNIVENIKSAVTIIRWMIVSDAVTRKCRIVTNRIMNTSIKMSTYPARAIIMSTPISTHPVMDIMGINMNIIIHMNHMINQTVKDITPLQNSPSRRIWMMLWGRANEGKYWMIYASPAVSTQINK